MGILEKVKPSRMQDFRLVTECTLQDLLTEKYVEDEFWPII